MMHDLPVARLQASHYAAVRARLFGPDRRQFVPVPLREWHAPTITEVSGIEGRVAAILSECAKLDKVTADVIIHATAAAFDIPATTITGKRRLAAFVEPRHIAIAICSMQFAGTPRGGPRAIGRAFGGRYHTTILYGIRKYGELVARVARSVAEQSA